MTRRVLLAVAALLASCSTPPSSSVTSASSSVVDAATAHAGRVYVANQLSGSVTVIDAASDTLLATVPTGYWVNGVAFSPDGKRAYVTRWSSALPASVLSAGATLAFWIEATSPSGGVIESRSGRTTAGRSRRHRRPAGARSATTRSRRGRRQQLALSLAGAHPGSPRPACDRRRLPARRRLSVQAPRLHRRWRVVVLARHGRIPPRRRQPDHVLAERRLDLPAADPLMLRRTS
jgi:YVTN family beta-propeller protein